MKKDVVVNIFIAQLFVLVLLFAAYIFIRFNENIPEPPAAAAVDYTPAQNTPGTIITKPPEEEEAAPPPSEDTIIPPAPVTVTLAGDVLLDRGIKDLIYNGGYEAVLSKEHRLPLTEADIAIINLEFPFSERGTPADKEYTFRGDPAHADFLTEMGVDIVSLANNHALDYGKDAFLDTLDILDKINVKYVGAGRDLSDAKRFEIIEINELKIAFISASRVVPEYAWYAREDNPGVFATYDPADLNEQISIAKTKADYVIVYVHWGIELNDKPEEYQREMAKGYIDNGASAVIGGHPHVLQGFEFYNGKPIVYSLGNFIFTNAKRDSMAVTLTFDKDDPIKVSVTPYAIKNLKTIMVEDEDEQRTLREYLEGISFDVMIDDDFVVSGV